MVPRAHGRVLLTTGPERRRKERARRAASRRLPPVRGHGGRRLQTGGRPSPVRMVGVGQFGEGLARRTDGRRRHGRGRIVGVVGAVLAGVVLVLFLIARVAGHL